MLKWALLIVGLNSADALLTYYAISLGATEWNPIMAHVLQQGVASFLFTKLIIVNILVILLVALSSYKTAKIGLFAASFLYSFILIYHVANLL